MFTDKQIDEYIASLRHSFSVQEQEIYEQAINDFRRFHTDPKYQVLYYTEDNQLRLTEEKFAHAADFYQKYPNYKLLRMVK